MPRRTKEEAAATRERILDAAAAVFAEHGLAHASLEQVAEKAGLTRGALYFHFKDKCALFEALMSCSPFPVDAVHAQGGCHASADALQALEQCLLEVLKLASTRADMRRTLEIVCEKVEYVGELLPLRARVQQARATWVDDISRLLEQAAQQGLLKPRLPRHALALGMAAQMEGLVRHWLVDPAAFDLVRVGRQNVQLQLQVLRNEAAPEARHRPTTRPSASLTGDRARD